MATQARRRLLPLSQMIAQPDVRFFSNDHAGVRVRAGCGLRITRDRPHLPSEFSRTMVFWNAFPLSNSKRGGREISEGARADESARCASDHHPLAFARRRGDVDNYCALGSVPTSEPFRNVLRTLVIGAISEFRCHKDGTRRPLHWTHSKFGKNRAKSLSLTPCFVKDIKVILRRESVR